MPTRNHYGIIGPIDRSEFEPESIREKIRANPLLRGFDDIFPVPHSRHSEIWREDIDKVPELEILSYSPLAGVYIGGKLFGAPGIFLMPLAMMVFRQMQGQKNGAADA